jgi:hypothetical protein
MKKYPSYKTEDGFDRQNGEYFVRLTSKTKCGAGTVQAECRSDSKAKAKAEALDELATAHEFHVRRHGCEDH